MALKRGMKRKMFQILNDFNSFLFVLRFDFNIRQWRPQSWCRLPRSPSQERPCLHEPPKTRPPPFLRRRTWKMELVSRVYFSPLRVSVIFLLLYKRRWLYMHNTYFYICMYMCVSVQFFPKTTSQHHQFLFLYISLKLLKIFLRSSPRNNNK